MIYFNAEICFLPDSCDLSSYSAFGCPYSALNMNRETTLQDRLGSTRAEEGQSTPVVPGSGDEDQSLDGMDSTKAEPGSPNSLDTPT